MIRLLRHLISILTVVFLALNLLFWLIPLSAMAVMRMLLSTESFRRWCFPITEASYRGAVLMNTLWLERVVGLKIDISGTFDIPRHESCVVIANHRCWIDIILLQALVVPSGPIVKFLVKKSLTYVPVVGWICLALDFPRMERRGSGKGSRADFDSLRSAADRMAAEPAALLNFVESTRFTEAKRTASKSKYKYLLNPKSGGLRILLASLPAEAKVLDATLIYPAHDPIFWDFISGAVKRVEIRVREHALSDVEELGVKSWLDARWQEKEAVLADSVGSL